MVKVGDPDDEKTPSPETYNEYWQNLLPQFANALDQQLDKQPEDLEKVVRLMLTW
jgi:hypothetical protein